MILNNLELIKTELGSIPVIVNEENNNGMVSFVGSMINNEMDIHIQTPTKESCLEGLKNAFEVKMDFWLNKQLK